MNVAMKHPPSPVLSTILFSELLGFLRDEREVADWRVGGPATSRTLVKRLKLIINRSCRFKRLALARAGDAMESGGAHPLPMEFSTIS